VEGAAFVYWFDFVSPYAWVGFRPSRALAAKHGRPFVPRPVLFAGLLDAHGLVGPAEVPAKRTYIFRDAYRKAHARGLPPLVLPPSHPFNPLVALRAAIAAPSADVVDRVDALFAAAWIEGRAIDTPEAVAAVVGAEAVEAASTPGVKARLREQTDLAAKRGIFGVPTLELDGELFWGSDALEHADAFLRGEDPVPKDPRYFERPASATRAARK
jgi:2-hydroxychromene-2-carboxylate isomerase